MHNPYEDYPRSADFDSRSMAAAWDVFMKGGTINGGDIRSTVYSSWQRCAALSIDPHETIAPALQKPEFQRRLGANTELLDAAGYTWTVMSESLIASDSLFVVTDADGVMLDVRGNDELVEAAAREHVASGHDWSEQASGTNAIGTALVVERPTIVRTTEHYCRSAQIWDCAAALVRDQNDGVLLGVLDVTSVGNLSDAHTLALAVTAAKHIEQTLHARELARSVQLLNWFRSNTDRWEDKPVILLDRKGRIVTASDSAGEMADMRGFRVDINGPMPELPVGHPLSLTDVVRYKWRIESESEETVMLTNEKWFGGVIYVEEQTPRAPGVSRHGEIKNVKSARHPAFSTIVTRDPVMYECMVKAERLARASSPILLTAETGSGKELFARAIHDCSAVSTGPFVAVNCGTLTIEMAASELLGYEPGAFTGASIKGRRGKIEEADGGTLFLDEVSELPMDVQVHLLRVVQDGVVVRLGGNRERVTSARIVAATNRDLGVEASRGLFRKDLYFRLKILDLMIPPLRERRPDIGLLADSFLVKLQGDYGLGSRTISPGLLSTLMAYDWPGNVRELHGLLESLYLLSDRVVLSTADLPNDFPQLDHNHTESSSPLFQTSNLATLERETILREVASNRGNMAEGARRLGISRATLYRKMKEYGVPRG